MPPKVQNASHTGMKIREPQSLLAKMWSSVPFTAGNRWSLVLAMRIARSLKRDSLQQDETPIVFQHTSSVSIVVGYIPIHSTRVHVEQAVV